MSMDQLLKSKKKIRTINSKSSQKVKPLKAEEPRTQSFEEKYQRMTTYVEKPLVEEIEKLRSKGVIRRKTEFVNAAFKEYIKNHY